MTAAAALACIVGVFGVPPPTALATAHAGWSARQAVGRGNYSLSGSSLVGDQRGDAALVWESEHGLRIAFATPGGRFGPSRVIAHRLRGGVVDAMDGRGDVIVAWEYNDGSVAFREGRGEGECCDHVRVAMVHAGGRNVSFETLTPGNASADVLSVAISEDGATVAVAYESTPKRAFVHPEGWGQMRLFLRVARFGSRFGRRVDLRGQRLSAPLQAHRGRVSALTQRGEATYMRETEVSQSGHVLRTPALQIPPLTCCTDSKPMFDLRGDEALILRHELTGELLEELTLKILTRGPGQSKFRSTLLTSASHPRESPAPWPRWSSGLAVAPSGRLLVTWSDPSGLHAALGGLPRARLAGATVVDPITPNREQFYSGEAAAIDSRGQGVILAMKLQINDSVTEAQGVIGVLCTPNGRFGYPILLDRSPHNPSDLATVIDEHGRGIAIWHENGEQIVARRFRVP